MKILILLTANGEYLKGAEIVINTFKANITNPEGHEIVFRVDEPNTEFDYLHFMNHHHAGTKISLCRFKYFNECEFDRVIYMDSDMQVVGNVDLLLSNELNSKPYWAVHVKGYEGYYGERMLERGVTNDMIINGGLQVINKPLLTAEFQQTLKDNLKVGESVDGSDQGYISELFPKLGIDIGWLPFQYNHCHQDRCYDKDLPDVRIKHYTGNKLF